MNHALHWLLSVVNSRLVLRSIWKEFRVCKEQMEEGVSVILHLLFLCWLVKWRATFHVGPSGFAFTIGMLIFKQKVSRYKNDFSRDFIEISSEL